MNTPSPESIGLHQLFDGLPPALKTTDNLALLKTYCLIPRTSGRRFVQVLIARLAGVTDVAPVQDEPAEAEYLLTHYDRLPTNDLRSKILSLARQVCVANGGDLEKLYEIPPRESG